MPKEFFMAQMLFTLPPLSPDYSGVASVFHDIRALTILHDASGCTGTYTGYDEPRWFGSASPVFCSGLREMDVILGKDDELLEKIGHALEDTHSPCVALIGSPVPMVIGFDFKGFSSLAEEKLGIPVFGFPATGLAYYDQGQKDAYLALAERFLGDGKSPGDKRGVNLLGASALDGFDSPSLDRLEALLNEGGLRKGAVWGSHSPLEELGRSPEAGANWVLSAAALPLARLLQKKYGIPFVAGLPIGGLETRRILSALSTCCRGDSPEAPPGGFPPAEDSGTPRLLLVGEALFCSSLRAYLEKECRRGPAKIGTFFAEGKELLHPERGDRFFVTEDDAQEFFAAPQADQIFADQLFKAFVPPGGDIQFNPVPHRAVSGRLYDEGRSRFFGPRPSL
jgi:hypothetical protein